MSNEKKSEQPEIKIFDPVTEINKKFDFYIKIVIGVLIVAISTMLIMVATLIIDSFHINAATYREYSEKLELNENFQNTLKELLNENKKIRR